MTARTLVMRKAIPDLWSMGRWGEHERKNSSSFIHLLYKLHRTYRRARRLILIVDNYVIHENRAAQNWLARRPKFDLVFQPTYVTLTDPLAIDLHEHMRIPYHCAAIVMDSADRELVSADAPPGTTSDLPPTH